MIARQLEFPGLESPRTTLEAYHDGLRMYREVYGPGGEQAGWEAMCDVYGDVEGAEVEMRRRWDDWQKMRAADAAEQARADGRAERRLDHAA